MATGGTTGDGAPWWSSGRTPEEGIDPDEDGFAAHESARRARAGGNGSERSDPDPPHWMTDLVDLLARIASSSTARMGGSPPRNGSAPHPPDQVCDACPVCIGLRAVREVRPETIAHLAEAARHISLALRSFADAQARAVVGDQDYEHIDLDPE